MVEANIQGENTILTDEFFLLNYDERTAAFELRYLQTFGRFANAGREDIRINMNNKLDSSKEEGMNLAQNIGDHISLKDPDLNKLIEQAGKQVAGAIFARAANYLVAKEIVAATVKGGVDTLSRRAAIVVVDQSTGMAAAQGAHAALNGIKLVSFAPALGAALGEYVGGAAARGLGITNYHAVNCMELGGAVIGGAGAGALVGGPAGAAAGAAVGVLCYTTGKGISALANSRLGVKGPNDNWCYVEVGNTHGYQVCIGTYAEGDTWYSKTYWKEYKNYPCSLVMSAGQGQHSAFQVSVWENNNRCIVTLKRVHYRDIIRIHLGDVFVYGQTVNWKWCVLHAKGEFWGSEGGQIELHHC